MQKGMATVGVEPSPPTRQLRVYCAPAMPMPPTIKDVNIQSIPTVTVITLLAPLTLGLIFK